MKKFLFAMTILIVDSLVFGTVNTWFGIVCTNFAQNGYHAEYITEMIVIAICMTILSAGRILSYKYSKSYLNNIQYDKLLRRVLDSKMSDISTISTGKIFDSVKEIAGYRTALIVDSIAFLTIIMPYGKLLLREAEFSIVLPIIEIVSLIIGTVMALLTNRLFKTNKIGAEKKAILQGVTVDNFLNVRTIKYLRQRQFAMDRLHKAQQDAMVFMVNPWQVLWFRGVELMCWVPFIVNLIIAKSDPALVAFMVVLTPTVNSMWDVARAVTENVVELKAKEDVIKSLKGDDLDNYDALENELVLRNIEFGYKDVNFSIDDIRIRKDERYLVTGESGQGKSTLANLLAGVLTPTKGEIKNISVFYVWQETEMFDATLRENILFNNQDNVSDEELMDLFKDLNMLEWFSNLPNGLDTQIGEKGCKLSSGQKQRLNIIRTVLHMRRHKDDLFIVDEITSNLDDATKNLAIALIDKECKSTLVCVSHNDGFDRICQHHIEVVNHRFNVLK